MICPPEVEPRRVDASRNTRSFSSNSTADWDRQSQPTSGHSSAFDSANAAHLEGMIFELELALDGLFKYLARA